MLFKDDQLDGGAGVEELEMGRQISPGGHNSPPGHILLHCLLCGAQRWTAIRAAVGSVASILTPFVWGAVLAYLLRPLLAAFQGRFFAPLAQRLTKNRRTGFAIARGLSVLMSEIVAVLIVAVLLWLIIPRFYESIQSIILALPDYYMSINRFATDFLDSYPELESLVRLWSGQIT